MEKNISVIGVGKLGIAFALNAEQAGFNVVGVDIDEKYVSDLNNKKITTYEPDVKRYLLNSRKFKATTSISEAIEHSNNIFLIVATPTDPEYGYDHSQVDDVVNKLISFGKQLNTKHLIICCTVLPGYTDKVSNLLQPFNWHVSYNPEFIAQGQIIRDQILPEIVLIGEGNEFVGNWLEEFYTHFCSLKPKFHRMSPLSAEITKISLNCFLTTKISYANMIGDICTIVGAETEKVLKAIGGDSRIGNKYLQYGYGYGGPCFPRDNRTLYKYSEKLGYKAAISIASDESNEQHLNFQVNNRLKNLDKNTPIVFDTVTYKPGTIILEESQQLKTAVMLADKGMDVRIIEHPEVIEQLKNAYGCLFTYIERQEKE